MIVKLRFENRLPVPVMLLNNQGSGQPLVPSQVLEMTFSMTEDADGVADLVLIVEPG